MLGPLRLRISALPMRRLSSDSAMTASGMDLYHSSGVNWDVIIVDPLCSRAAMMLKSWFAVSPLIGVVRKSSRISRSVATSLVRNCCLSGSWMSMTARVDASSSVRQKRQV